MRPRLRAGVEIRPQRHHGQEWRVAHDPASGHQFRMNDSAYQFIARLDGRRTVDDAWVQASEAIGDDAPTQGESIRLLGQLWSSGLLSSDVPADVAPLLQRMRRKSTRRVQMSPASLLALRIPLFDPDRLLNGMALALGWVVSPIGAAMWIVLVGLGLSQLAGRGDELGASASDALAPAGLPWLYLVVVLIKLAHELAHGLTCKVFARREGNPGEVHTLGIMFLVLLPVPYIDASSAWNIRSKWRRAIVGAAGMIAELAIAGIAAIVWVRTDQGALVHGLAFNAMLVAGVSTLLFNANPLLRYDGYYILSDLLEIPNLQQRARESLTTFVRRNIWRVRSRRAIPRVWQRPAESVLLPIFGIASSVYRVFITIAIAMFVADQLFFVGAILATTAIVFWIIVPVARLLHYLATSSELIGTRLWATVSTGGAIAAALIAIGVVPAPSAVRMDGVVESPGLVRVRVESPGFVRVAAAEPGRVSAGDVLLQLEDPVIAGQIAEVGARIARAKARRRALLEDEPARAMLEQQRIDALSTQLSFLQDQQDSLQITSAVDGTWSPDPGAMRLGSFLPRTEEIGVIVPALDIRIRASAGQESAGRFAGAPPASVEVRSVARDRSTQQGSIERVARSDADPRGVHRRPFDVFVELADNGTPFLVGEPVVVRVAFAAEPVGAQVRRAIERAFQRRFGDAP